MEADPSRIDEGEMDIVPCIYFLFYSGRQPKANDDNARRQDRRSASCVSLPILTPRALQNAAELRRNPGTDRRRLRRAPQDGRDQIQRRPHQGVERRAVFDGDLPSHGLQMDAAARRAGAIPAAIPAARGDARTEAEAGGERRRAGAEAEVYEAADKAEHGGEDAESGVGATADEFARSEHGDV